MVKCARCGRDVDDIENITPAAVTEELIESIDQSEESLGRKSLMKVCVECMNELN